MIEGCYRGPALAEVLVGALFRCIAPVDCSLHAWPALGSEMLLVATFFARSLLWGLLGFEVNSDACCCAIAAATEPPPAFSWPPRQLGHGSILPWRLRFWDGVCRWTSSRLCSPLLLRRAVRCIRGYGRPMPVASAMHVLLLRFASTSRRLRCTGWALTPLLRVFLYFDLITSPWQGSVSRLPSEMKSEIDAASIGRSGDRQMP